MAMSNAERQAEHRARVKARLALRPSPPKSTKAPSLSSRLAAAALLLHDLAVAYKSWAESMPENLQESDLHTRLEAAAEILHEAADLVHNIDVPGRR